MRLVKALGVAAVVGFASAGLTTAAAQTAEHPDTPEPELRYKGAPIPEHEARQIVTPGAPPLLDRERLARMRAGALVVNCARGGLVDEVALLEALDEGRLGGAFLDVFAREPYDGPLVRSDRVVLAPHIGSYAIEGRVAMEMESVDNLLRVLEGAR